MAKYTGSQKKPYLELRYKYFGEDSLEIELVNLQFQNQIRSRLKHIFVLSCVFALYFACFAFDNNLRLPYLNEKRILCPTIAFVIIVVQILAFSSNLVHSEKIYCSPALMQLQIVRAFSRRSHQSIPTQCIYDVLINEMFEDIDVRHILIILTKGELFAEQEIIPIFKQLRPSANCLRNIYLLLNNMMRLREE